MENNTEYFEQILQEENTSEPVSVQPAALPKSHFDGNTLQLLGWRLLGILLCLITLGIGTPWVNCWIMRWETKHTVVNGRRLYFDGTGLQLLGMYLLCGLLSLVTFGIYIFFIPVKMRKWRASHTRLASDAEAAAAMKRLPIWATVLIVILVIALLVVLVGGAAAAYLYLIPVAGLQNPLANLDLGGFGQAEDEWIHDEWTDETWPDMSYIINPDGSITVIQPGSAEYDSTEPDFVDPVNYYVTAKGGLWLRSGPGTDAEQLVLMRQNTLVVPMYWENGWAYVEFEGIYGWCSGEYLSTEPVQTSSGGDSGNHSGGDSGSSTGNGYTEDEIRSAIDAANAIIDSYRGKTPSQGHTTMDASKVTQFYEEAAGVQDNEMFFAGLFDRMLGELPLRDPDMYYSFWYQQVEDDKFRTIEDLCDYYFSYFTDDYAASLLKGSVFVLDGKMYAYAGAYGVEAVYHSHRFEVVEENGCFLVTTIVKEFREYEPEGQQFSEFSMTHKCVKEDGIWVFESASTIYT